MFTVCCVGEVTKRVRSIGATDMSGMLISGRGRVLHTPPQQEATLSIRVHLTKPSWSILLIGSCCFDPAPACSAKPSKESLSITRETTRPGPQPEQRSRSLHIWIDCKDARRDHETAHAETKLGLDLLLLRSFDAMLLRGRRLCVSFWQSVTSLHRPKILSSGTRVGELSMNKRKDTRMSEFRASPPAPSVETGGFVITN